MTNRMPVYPDDLFDPTGEPVRLLLKSRLALTVYKAARFERNSSPQRGFPSANALPLIQPH